jgi:hypothetical protein
LFSPTEGDPTVGKKLKQVGVGTVVGTGLGAIAPKVSPEVKVLQDEKIRLTPGMRMIPFRKAEEISRSIPIVGGAITKAELTARDDFIRATYNRVLEPVGEKYSARDPLGYDGVRKLSERLGGMYDRLLSNVRFIAISPDRVPYGLTVPDMQGLAQKLRLMTPAARQQWANIVSNVYEAMVPPSRVITGKVFKKIEGDLLANVRKYAGANTADERGISESLDEYVQLMRKSLGVQNPSTAAELAKINQAYSRFVVVQLATQHRASTNGIFTPGDFIASIRGNDPSIRNIDFSRGLIDMMDLAVAANKVMTPHLGTSGTAERSLGIELARRTAVGAGAGVGAGTGYFAGLPMQAIERLALALGAASVPYRRLPADWSQALNTANIGSRGFQWAWPNVAPQAAGAAAARNEPAITTKLGLPQ